MVNGKYVYEALDISCTVALTINSYKLGNKNYRSVWLNYPFK